MNTIFIANQLPEKAIQQFRDAQIAFDYWNHLEEISEDRLIQSLEGKEILICGVDVSVTKKVIEAVPTLKLIANVGDGYSNIDIDMARLKGIKVTNAPTIDSIASTAELTVTLLLTLSRDILNSDQLMRSGKFIGWRVTGYVGGHQMYGKKILIVGLGRVGKLVAEMLQGFHMDIYYTDPIAADAAFEERCHLKRVSLEEGLSVADYVTLNCDLTAENMGMIGIDQLKQMKKEAYLINCARGPLVKEADLVTALEEHVIAGAALDVYEFEPKVSEKLVNMRNTVLTPHTGNATYEARNEMAMDAVTETIRYLKGEDLLYPV